MSKCKEMIKELEKVKFIFPDSKLGKAFCLPDDLPSLEPKKKKVNHLKK